MSCGLKNHIRLSINMKNSAVKLPKEVQKYLESYDSDPRRSSSAHENCYKHERIALYLKLRKMNRVGHFETLKKPQGFREVVGTMMTQIDRETSKEGPIRGTENTSSHKRAWVPLEAPSILSTKEEMPL